MSYLLFYVMLLEVGLLCVFGSPADIVDNSIYVGLASYSKPSINHRILSVSNVPTSEIDALHDLYTATNGANWTCCSAGEIRWNFTDASANPCTDNWQGITCVNTTYQYFVSRLELDSGNLKGTLPSSLSNLSNLTVLDMNDNYISGMLPSSLGSFSQLLLLDFDFNSLNGSIPSSFGNLHSLSVFSIYTNDISGTIPTSLSSLSNVVYFDLGDNRLKGPIPDIFADFSKILTIYFNFNSLTGSIPQSIGYLTKLSSINIHDNLLTGAIPNNWANLTSAVTMNIHTNALTGTLPTFLFSLSTLRFLYINENSFHGELPSQLGNLSNIVYFNIFNNMFTGCLPVSIGNMSALKGMDADNNHLEGTLPSSLGQLSVLIDLSVSLNSFTGALPSTLQRLSLLQYLYASDNLLSGTMPAGTGKMYGIVFLDLSNNLLTGNIPSLSNCSFLLQLQLQYNQLSGSIENVFDSSAQVLLTNIQINNNQLTGTLPTELFALSSLRTLVAVSNCFHGTLPSNVCSAKSMRILVLDGLSSATSCRDIIFPGLSSSYLLQKTVGGSIAECLYQLPNISSLHLSGNGFDGELPSGDNLGPFLRDLAISHNMLKGTIAQSFQEWDWVNLDLSYNRIVGTLSSNAPVLGNTTLYLENNRISGTIPDALVDLQEISILGSNMFECLLNGNGLPKHDEGRHNYQCDSSDFDVLYYIWLDLVGFSVLMYFVIWRWRLFLEKYFGIAALCQLLTEWLHYTNPNSIIRTPHVDVGQLFAAILEITAFCAIFIVVILLPVYLAMTTYYGTYTFEYAFAASAAFMSGDIPFALEFAFWLLFLRGVCYLLYKNLIAKKQKVEIDFKKLDDQSFTSFQHFAICTSYLVANLLVVGGVNVAFLYFAIYQNSSFLALEQVLLSFFKIVWNQFCNPFILRHTAGLITPAVRTSRVFEIRFSTLQVCVAMINNILIPLVVNGFISPNCFYHAFYASPMINSNYESEVCIYFNNDTCQRLESIPEQSQYTPPFEYSYQCSSSLITYYAPTFVALCITTCFIVPTVKFIVLQLHKAADRGTQWFQLLDIVIPRILEPIPELDNEKDKDNMRLGGSATYFNANRIFVILATNLGLLLTYGVVFPPLAASLALSVFVIVYSARLELGRFIADALKKHQYKYKDIVDMECQGVGSTSVLTDIIWILIVVSCLFYTLFLFDTYGDAVGFDEAYWVLIVVPLMPVCIYVLHVLTADIDLRIVFGHDGVDSRTASTLGIQLDAMAQKTTSNDESPALSPAICEFPASSPAASEHAAPSEDVTYNALLKNMTGDKVNVETSVSVL